MPVIFAADHLVKLTHIDAAVPFLVAAVLAVIGAVVEEFVTDKVESVLNNWLLQAGTSAERLPYAFQPGSVAQMSTWTIDTAQIVTTILAPLVGLVLLVHQGGSIVVVLADVIIFLAALLAFRNFWKKRPDEYAVGWPPVLTPLTVIALVLNLAGAGIGYGLGP